MTTSNSTWDVGDPPKLSMEELERCIKALGKIPLYYLTDAYCAKHKMDGSKEEVVFALELKDCWGQVRRVALMHPDVLPSFIERAEEAGFAPERFMWEYHYTPSSWTAIAERALREQSREFLRKLYRTEP